MVSNATPGTRVVTCYNMLSVIIVLCLYIHMHDLHIFIPPELRLELPDL